MAPTSAWRPLLYGALLLALLLWPAYADDTQWIGAGLLLTAIVAGHSLLASRHAPWIPGLIGLVACLQWVVVPWLAYHVRATFPLYDMVIPPAAYFSFAIPAAAALVLGLHAPLAGVGRPARRGAPPGAAAHVRATCEAMVWAGLALDLVIAPLAPPALGFAVRLLGNIAFVGAFGLLLIRAPGWPWRVGAAFAPLLLRSSAEGMFHDLLLWLAYFLLLAAFTFRVRARWLAVGAVGVAVVVMSLNGVKQQYRELLELRPSLSAAARVGLLADALVDVAAEPDLLLSDENISLNITRLNQGWIIARVLSHVPVAEPYAEGETVRETLRATFLPRVLAPDKLAIGGHAYFERFTGVALAPGTSMDLSVAGELYANYGRAGAVAGVFVFGALIGLVYRLFVRWSRGSVLWWAWAPYVLLYTAKAEGGLAEPLNHVFKSFVVMLVMIELLPGWARLRQLHLRRRLASAVGAGRPGVGGEAAAGGRG